jgi:DNA-binding MarR family transcriptional regulator
MPLRFIPQVHRAAHRIALHVEALGAPAVTQAEAHILAHLASSDRATVAELHRAFAHKRSTLTSILDRLEHRALVARTSDRRDRRTFVISLTSRGRTLARRVSAHLAAFEARALQQVSADDAAAFVRVLDALERATGEN